MSSNLSDKTIVVTGGASGIGEATVRHIATTGQGSYITIIDVQDSAGEAIARSLDEETKCHVQYVHCDVRSWDEQASAFRRAIEFSASKKLDVVICCAGIQEDSKLINNVVAAADESDDVHQIPPAPSKAIEVNLTGQYYTAWLACYYFRLGEKGVGDDRDRDHDRTKSKSLVLVASLAGFVSLPNTSTTYWMSKWGLRGLFHSIRHDVARVGARVNLVAPYWVKTALVKTFQLNETPPGGWTEMEDVVGTIVDCAEDESVDGRSFAIFPPPIKKVDLEDNPEGAFGGEMVRKVSASLIPSFSKMTGGQGGAGK